MTTTKPALTRVPPPPAYRLLLVPVGLTVLVVLIVFVTTLLQFNDILTTEQAANPSAPHGALIARMWGRLAFGGLLAASWPLALRQLGRGSTKVYARCRRIAVLAAVVLLAVALFGSGPAWEHAAHGILAASELGIFAATMHPQLRAWYKTHR